MVDYAEIDEALELATGTRRGECSTAAACDIRVTRRTILLFLGEINPCMTVGELCEELNG